MGARMTKKVRSGQAVVVSGEVPKKRKKRVIVISGEEVRRPDTKRKRVVVEKVKTTATAAPAIAAFNVWQNESLLNAYLTE